MRYIESERSRRFRAFAPTFQWTAAWPTTSAPALYGAKYRALIANRSPDGSKQLVTVAGRYCESGDVLLRDIELPSLRRGDVLAVPAAGAYHMSMASNYNLVGRPATVLVRDGKARVTRRRETDADLLAAFAPDEA